MPQRILIVDDVREIVQGLAAYFRQAGFETLAAYDGRSALDLARRERPDLIILDWMMPELDGLEVCRQLRRESSVPIIMLTARVEETDTLIGLELGADDYIAKPFRAREVVARARAILRRASGALAPPSMVRGGGVSLDLDRHTTEVAGHTVELTPTEFALLLALMRNPGRPLSRAQLLDAAQGDAFEGYERTIDAHIKNLRRKIEADPANPRRILTVFGVGYKFVDAE
ncbi:two component transcriptional regulator [Oscillochloris trichoides DG-6]|uniref:Two component transcriptional regulator n=1 Tax=Oscillochloris trichoides DG-6 TaxID=765420 RepID=E1IB32_9CHLR|nr:response regulator transcription factor [Oscillochloris trichoides]EFO81603.1 two component transcriptional regulator [Oscillochloris trichoides DG-6]